jgi:uracil phosphoribosyltransferase
MDSRITFLGSPQSYVSQIMSELRDRNTQTDRLRFRNNLQKMGYFLAYEVSKKLTYMPKQVNTPLGEIAVDVLDQQPLIVSILRAGMPLHQGFLEIFDHADNGFISAYRHHTKGNEFTIKLDYIAMPEVEGRDLILVDPMIATGSSIVLCYQAILALGTPRSVHIAGVIASDEGLQNVLRKIPNAQLYVAAVDTELTARAYIVPGLGDAGDLAFGLKDR